MELNLESLGLVDNLIIDSHSKSDQIEAALLTLLNIKNSYWITVDFNDRKSRLRHAPNETLDGPNGSLIRSLNHYRTDLIILCLNLFKSGRNGQKLISDFCPL